MNVLNVTLSHLNYTVGLMSYPLKTVDKRTHKKVGVAGGQGDSLVMIQAHDVGVDFPSCLAVTYNGMVPLIQVNVTQNATFTGLLAVKIM